jgi:predicted RecB family nuclease
MVTAEKTPDGHLVGAKGDVLQIRGDGLLLSASDLVAFLGCRHATWLDLRALHGGPKAPQQVDPQTELLRQKGLEHERAYLERLASQGLSVESIPASLTPDDRVAATLAAMRRGADVIYQGALLGEPWHGYSDFLRKVDVPSALGAWSYIVLDTKLSRTAKPSHVIQLGVYALLLEDVQGIMPLTVGVLLGDGTEAVLRTHDYTYYMRAAAERLLRFAAEPPASSAPEPCAQCQYCRWRPVCEAEWEKADHLSLVANMRSSQAKHLREAGIATVAGLAAYAGSSVKGVPDAVLKRLKSQAALQVAKRKDGRNRHEILAVEPGRGFCRLPRPDPGDLFFDMEGDPLIPGGLEYLFGFTLGPGSAPPFRAFWAHTREEEKQAFERAVDFMVAQLAARPSAHIYHYASYEASAIKRLSIVHGAREAEVDELLRSRKLVDLYRVVTEGVRVSEPRYSIKNIESFYMAGRTGDVRTAGESVVVYERWRKLQDPALLAEIEEYNRVDCVSTGLLRDWLLSIRPDAATWFSAMTAAGEDEKAAERQQAEQRTERMRAALARCHAPGAGTLADLLEFHRREAKPEFWAMFDRQYRPEEDLIEDADCLGGVHAIGVAPVPVKQSFVFTFGFPAQDFKIRDEDRPLLSESLDPAGEVVDIDEETRRIQIKRGRKSGALPQRFSLLPPKPIKTDNQKAAIFRVADAVCRGDGRYKAVRSLLDKAHPRLLGGRVLQDLATDPLARAISATTALDESYLLIQGPPGAGKTYTSACAIVALLEAGKRVGVASNSHKAVNTLLAEVETVALSRGLRFRGIKKSSKEAQFYEGTMIANTMENEDVPGYQLIGGTAWLFCREELDQHLDYLFVDEAGQVSLGNIVAMGTCARNLVLVGDQMQLGQPLKGAHPGETGLSALEYVLGAKPTVPPEMGVFLPASRRMHPDVCRFISAAFYEGRLEPESGNERQRLVLAAEAHPALRASGLSFVEVDHVGCTQRSDEEAVVISDIVASLTDQRWVNRDGVEKQIGIPDILVVTPYNMQVANLEGALPAGIKIGTVDKFQGQQAPVVVLSMTTSSAEEMPREHEFLFSRNRLNVAISRAQGLAIVVASRRLLEVPCRTVEQVKLVNALCWAEAYSRTQAPSRGPPERISRGLAA